MTIIRHSLRATSRNQGKSIIVMAVSLVLVLFLTIYARAITQHRQTLAELHGEIEVTGHITNYNGTVTENLSIKENIIEDLEASDFIGEGYYTRNLRWVLQSLAGLEEIEVQNAIMTAGRLVGANTIQALPEFMTKDAVQPQYLAGYDEGLFASSAEVCIVREDILQSLELQLGDMATFTVADNSLVKSAEHPRAEIALKIVGTYSASMPNQAYCPWDITTAIYQDLGLPLTWGSAHFSIINTQRLDEFKVLLNSLHFASPNEVGLDALTSGNKLGFIINDRILANVNATVQGYIEFMQALYPVIYLLSAGIGFVISYLLIRLRKPELAIMRSLGTSPGMAFLSFLWEQIVLSLIGAVLGTIITLVITRSVTSLQTLSIVGYLIFYMAGAAMAIANMNNINVVQILTSKE